MADIDRHDLLGSAPQQDLGEAARAGPGVQAATPPYRQTRRVGAARQAGEVSELVECAVELPCGSADICLSGTLLPEPNRGLWGDSDRGLARHIPVEVHRPVADQADRVLSRSRQPTTHEFSVEATIVPHDVQTCSWDSRCW